MPSQIKKEAVASSVLVGKLHATMSRDVMRREIASERATAAVSVSDQDFYAHTLKAEKKACKLAVRDGLGLVTTPLGAITGTARSREEYKYKKAASDDGMDRFFGQAGLGWKHITEHFGDEGVVGAGAYLLTYGSMGTAALVTSPTVCVLGGGGVAIMALAAAGTGFVVGNVGWGLWQLAAIPGAGLKAAGNGVGNVYGAAVANKRAKKALKARQDARAAGLQPDAAQV